MHDWIMACFSKIAASDFVPQRSPVSCYSSRKDALVLPISPVTFMKLAIVTDLCVLELLRGGVFFVVGDDAHCHMFN